MKWLHQYFLPSKSYAIACVYKINQIFCIFKQMKEAIRYLEFCVEKLGNRETAIHNFLLSLYAKQTDKTLLLKYLYKHSKVCLSVCLSMFTGVLLG